MQQRPDSKILAIVLTASHAAASPSWLKKGGALLVALTVWGFAGNAPAQTAAAVADSPAGSSANALLTKHSALASKLDGGVDVTQVYSTQSAFAALRADGVDVVLLTPV